MAEHRCTTDLPDPKTLDDGESAECPGCTRRLSVVDGTWRHHTPAPIDDSVVPEFGEWLHARLADTKGTPDPLALLTEYVALSQAEAHALTAYLDLPRHVARQADSEARQYEAHAAAMKGKR